MDEIRTNDQHDTNKIRHAYELIPDSVRTKYLQNMDTIKTKYRYRQNTHNIQTTHRQNTDKIQSTYRHHTENIQTTCLEYIFYRCKTTLKHIRYIASSVGLVSKSLSALGTTFGQNTAKIANNIYTKYLSIMKKMLQMLWTIKLWTNTDTIQTIRTKH